MEKTMTRRDVIAAGGAAALAAVIARPSRALATTRTLPFNQITWNNPFENGGRANAIAADRNTAHRACLMGDTWGGPHLSTDGGTWQPAMGGVQNGLNGVYGRTVYSSLSEPGTFYMGVGELKTTGGEFHALTPSGLEIRSNLGFSDNAASGAAGTMPRTGCGRLITSVIDATSGKEVIYALIHTGLYESTDLGSSWKLVTSAVGGQSQKALTAIGTNLIMIASYSADQTTPNKVWMYVRSTSKLFSIPNTGVVNDFCWEGAGTKGMAAGDQIYWCDTSAKTLDPRFSDTGCVFASIDSAPGGLVVAITSQSPNGSAKHVCVSRDGGTTWTWCLTPPSGSQKFSPSVIMQSVGSSNPYPLSFALNSLGGPDFQGAMISIDRQDPNYWYIAGTGGAWVTQDGGQTFRPMGVGAGGGTGGQLRLDDSTGGVTVTDQDWTGWSTTDHFQTYTRNQSPGSMPAAAVTRSTAYGTLDASNPGQITLGGVDISDAYYQQAAFKVVDVQMGADNYIYATLKAGNTLVGTPS